MNDAEFDPALVEKAARALPWVTADSWERNVQHARAVLSAVADDLRAEGGRKALLDMRRLAVRCYPTGLVSTGTVVADLNEAVARIEGGAA